MKGMCKINSASGEVARQQTTSCAWTRTGRLLDRWHGKRNKVEILRQAPANYTEFSY
jgi:hypothetical protein